MAALRELSLRGSVASGRVFDHQLLDRVYDQICDGLVGEGMDELMSALHLQRSRAHDSDWARVRERCLQHPLRELLHEDPFTHRAFKKPRGYAGDAVLIDFIYGREEHWPVPEGTSELGRKIFEYTTRTAACEGVRARRGFIADLLDHLVGEVHQPHVLSVAAGHLREALLCAALKRRKVGRYVALDADRESLAEVDRCYGMYGVETVAGTVRQVLTNRLDLGRFDLIYSTGLLDYISEAAAERLVWSLFQMLRPRGRLLVANFLPGVSGIGYMEAYMDWNLIYRTRREMLDVSMSIPQSEIKDIQIFTEENQNIIFMQITKR